MTTTRISSSLSALPDKDKKSEQAQSSSYIWVPSFRPTKNRQKDNFVEKEALPKETFHNIKKIIEIGPEEIRTLFLKLNPSGSYVSELEAAVASFYRLHAPYLVPAYYAIFDKTNMYMGVASEEIPGFKSTAQNPLKEEDLDTSFMEQRGLSIDLMDSLDAKLRDLELESQRLDRVTARLDFSETQIKDQIRQLNKYEEAKDLDDLVKESENIYAAKKVNTAAILKSVKEIRQFYADIKKDPGITVKELENYRIKKGLGICFALSHIFEEEDLHQNNFSKFGERFDFDMSLWPILYHYKDSYLIKTREPTVDLDKETFKVSSVDILKFPSIEVAKPTYWPTKSQSGISSTITLALSQYFNLSKNAYPEKANSLFKRLEKDAVFMHHAFNTFAKFILSEANMYRSLAASHIRQECLYIDKNNLIAVITEHMSDRITHFENALLPIHAFSKFYIQNHEKIEKELTGDLLKQGVKFDPESLKLKRDQLLEEARTKLTKADFRVAESLPRAVIRTAEILEAKKIDPANAASKADSKSSEETPKEVSVTSEMPKDLKGLSKEKVPSMAVKFLEDMKAMVKTDMENYKNPGFFSGFGIFRSHHVEAKAITDLCDTLNISNDDDGALKATDTLKIKITATMGAVQTGEFFETLKSLLRKIDKITPVKVPIAAPVKS